MLSFRLMILLSVFAAATALSIVMPVYGTGDEPSSSTAETNAETKGQPQPSAQPVDMPPSSDEQSDVPPMTPELTLVEKLQARLAQLEEREQRLRDDEQRLSALRQDLKELAARQEKAIAEAMAIREEHATTEDSDQSQESLNHLIKVYEAMDPEEAALRISEMDEALALDILAGIKDRKAAGMLAGVEPAKAAKLSQGLRHYHTRKRKTTP